jgi:hypothetical protein
MHIPDRYGQAKEHVKYDEGEDRRPSTFSGRKVEESDEQSDEHRTEDCVDHDHS